MKLVSLVLTVLFLVGCGVAPVEAKTTPQVTSVSSPYVISGTTTAITIFGANFSSNSNVMLDGYTYSPYSRTSTSMNFSVPSTTAVGVHTIQVKTANLTSNKVQITVVPPLVITNYMSVPGLMQFQSASFQFAATGGLGPYWWEVTAGTLPPGMTVSTTGLFSGKPTAFGSFNFTLTVHDQTGLTYALDFRVDTNGVKDV